MFPQVRHTKLRPLPEESNLRQGQCADCNSFPAFDRRLPVKGVMDLRRAFAVSEPCSHSAPLHGDVCASSLVFCALHFSLPEQTLRLDANTATIEEVTRAYKRMALQAHPDKGGDTATFQRLNEAFQRCKNHLEGDETGVDGDEELFEYFAVFIPKHVADWLESMMREERLRAERRKEQLRRRLELERQLSRPEARQLRRLRQELQDLLHSAQMLFATAVANSTRAELNALKRAEATLDDDDLSLRLGQAEEALTQLKIRVKKEQQNLWSRQAEAAMEKQRRSEEHNQQKIKRQEEKAMREQKAEEERKDWEVCVCARVCVCV